VQWLVNDLMLINHADPLSYRPSGESGDWTEDTLAPDDNNHVVEGLLPETLYDIQLIPVYSDRVNE